MTLVSCLLIAVQALKGQNLATELDAIAQSNDMMGGAVVVFCENQILDTHYFGKSDLLRNIDIGANTKFRIASISKTITAIAILQLVEEGLLDLEADISTVLGYEVRNPHCPDIPITVRMLLSHTSTIIDGPTYSSFLQATVNNNPIPNLSLLLAPSGSFYNADQFNTVPPGTYFNYSNLNFVILGTIVEKVSNVRFDRYCHQNIFEPLGLDASFNVNDLDNINELAVLYRKSNGSWNPQVDNYQGLQPVFANLENYVPGTNGGRFGPQGGLRCSAEDLASIFMCLFHPDNCSSAILSEETVQEMISNEWAYDGSNGNDYYGLFRSWGLGIQRVTSTPGKDIVLSGSSEMFGHAGEAYGLVSDLYYDTTRQVGVAFMTNGVGIGYQLASTSAFYTVEQEIFDAIEAYGNIEGCLISSLDPDLDQRTTFHLFPNPVGEVLHLEFEEFKKSSPLQIYGLEGRLVLESSVVSPKQILDVSQLKAGFYILEFAGVKKRFIKL